MTNGAAFPQSSVPASWARIDTWLRRHAPTDFALLRPPADPEAVEAAQSEMGVRFPPDLLASLACHDGKEEGIQGWSPVLPKPPLPVAGIAAHWRMCVDEYDPAEEEDLLEDGEEPWWHPSWIPWAALGGDSQVIDMRPGPDQGRLGSAVHDDRGGFERAWPSLGAYLEEVADALENGGLVDGMLSPRVDSEGRLRWERAL
ncbi:SMI1/KNR4 family protein [Nocardiopsis sp. RSe5-2]|uniref:SMI1/KNR4 family protein n=1 Tax=Nocardiopsis endophytica TaxID=3018445 RepID=A0ABT4UD10_9ACTN|nr:SMI1/KNR4 family protein [Nocardiopsis endophytica]MDA2814870.1 SMI1/KNR4 family protein [Nocardiopsis endophytica]